MSGALRHLLSLPGDTRGNMIIESAFVVPILLVLSLGGYEVSNVAARHSELRAAASEAAALVLSTEPQAGDDFSTIEDIVEASTGLDDADVILAERYRCGTNASLTANPSDCGSSDVVSTFIVLTMNETYTPIWKDFGIGSDVVLNTQRRVQIG